MPTSRATLLRLVHQAPLPAVGSPRVLGVDDWSQQRGHTYGTILVDAEQRRPVDLLPDRTATSLAEWLQAYPSIEVVTRDRSATYAEGAARGAPQAIQVADRFHVIVRRVGAWLIPFAERRVFGATGPLSQRLTRG
jgi:transposase